MEDIFGQLSQQLINGITIGGVYALIAVGYTMVYGVLSMLNFAHGELYMIGGFTGWWVLQIFSINHVPVMNAALLISLMIVISMGASAVLGLVVERIAYRPLRKAPRMNLLLSSLGVSIFIQNFILYFQGAKVKVFHISQLIPDGLRTFHIGGTVISFMRVLVIVVCFILMVLLTLIIKKTAIGKSIRATAQDIEAAAFMGIDTNRVIVSVFLIGSALGGAAGVLVSMLFTQVDYYVGLQAGLKGFTAAVLGGIGSIPGAMAGGLLLGVSEAMAVTFFPSAYKDVVAFLILIAVLIFRPQGLWGEKLREKV